MTTEQLTTVAAKTPKLRTRQQLTVRYKQQYDELVFWQNVHASCQIVAALPVIDKLIARCEGELNALRYALNDRVNE